LSRKIRVIVLFGGRSGEHEVSLHSAETVIKSLDNKKYDVLPVVINRDGRWLAGVMPSLLMGAGPDIHCGTDAGGGSVVVLPPDPSFGGLIKTGAGSFNKGVIPADVVIPVLHGTYGEDGTVQGLLELANIPYVGAGVLGSALGMDKVIMKTVLEYHGFPGPKFRSCLRTGREKDRESIIRDVEKYLGYPCFIKPANLGSSVGISKARNRAELCQAVDLAARYDRKIIFEENIDAREVEVSVLGNDDPIASLPGEIIAGNEFYDYEAKYLNDRSRLVIPAELPLAVIARLRELAVKVFKSLDCAGMARVDFFIRRSDGEVLVNEINTIPGFTRFSMYPKLWEATGINYSELLDRLIDLAFERHQEKNRSQTSR